MDRTLFRSPMRGGDGPRVPWNLYENMDRARLRQGQWLAAAGWGPKEIPSRPVLQRPGLTLKGYASPDASGPVALLVPAPIKRSYLWDLAPGCSVVRAFLERGMRPYLIHWETPEEEAGLAEYGVDRITECVEGIQSECGSGPVSLAGHSLGGVLATLFAAARPDLAKALVLLGTPLHFGVSGKEGALGPVVQEAGAKGLLDRLPSRVPGSFVSLAGFTASPAAFGRERWRDWWRSLGDREAMGTHMRVERWSLDELPLPGRLMGELLDGFYRRDAFMAGALRCKDRLLLPRDVTASLLVVAESNCAIVPPSAILPFYEAAGSRDKTLLWYEGDVGVAIQHVGSLVGRNAHARLWPQILAWIGERGRP